MDIKERFFTFLVDKPEVKVFFIIKLLYCVVLSNWKFHPDEEAMQKYSLCFLTLNWLDAQTIHVNHFVLALQIMFLVLNRNLSGVGHTYSMYTTKY